MTFKDAVERTPQLQNAYQPGLQALGRYSAKVRYKDSWRLTGSVNLEKALKCAYPEESLWDYGIGFRRSNTEEAIWIEVHSAAATHVNRVLKKLQWLKRWLKKKAPQLNQLSRGFYWIATGPSHITPHSRQAKKLANEGLRGPISRLDLDNL